MVSTYVPTCPHPPWEPAVNLQDLLGPYWVFAGPVGSQALLVITAMITAISGMQHAKLAKHHPPAYVAIP